MAKALVVVESPAKAKTINKYLGRDYKVVASMGHIRDLPKSKLGVDVENDFEETYESIESRKKVIKELKDAAKEASDIYVATDPDREGEAIGWHLTEELKGNKRKIHRLTFNEVTKKAVEEALKNPRAIDKKMVAAQRAREQVRGGDRVLDRQVDPDAAHRRHRVCRVADAEQSRTVPIAQAVHLHHEQLHLVPRGDLAHAIGRERHQVREGGAKRLPTAHHRSTR